MHLFDVTNIYAHFETYCTIMFILFPILLEDPKNGKDSGLTEYNRKKSTCDQEKFKKKRSKNGKS